jgi:hypothetical protein
MGLQFDAISEATPAEVAADVRTELAGTRLQPFEGSSLVLLHEAAVADHVSSENGSKAAWRSMHAGDRSMLDCPEARRCWLGPSSPDSACRRRVRVTASGRGEPCHYRPWRTAPSCRGARFSKHHPPSQAPQ